MTTPAPTPPKPQSASEVLAAFRGAVEHRRAVRAHDLLDRLLGLFGERYARAKRELLPDGDHLIPIWSIEVFGAVAGQGGAAALSAGSRHSMVGRRYLVADSDGEVTLEL